MLFRRNLPLPSSRQIKQFQDSCCGSCGWKAPDGGSLWPRYMWISRRLPSLTWYRVRCVASLGPKPQTVLPKHRHLFYPSCSDSYKPDVSLSICLWMGFDPRPVRVTFIADEVALAEVFHPLLLFFPVSISPLLLRTDRYLALTLHNLFCRRHP